ncbi:Ribosome assembly protein 3 [Kluyveromyces marxianus]
MSQGDIAVKKSAKRKNRRKKRRTQDVSDSESSSSSSSSSDGEEVQNQDLDQDEDQVEASVEASVAEMDVDVVLSDDELPREMSKDTVERLSEVKLTTSDLTGTHGIHLGNIDLQKMAGNLDASREKFQGQDKSGLKNEYLSMLFESYGDDMNELRQAPDFTNKTLVMLANVLKDGGDMFDVETLKTVVEGGK